MFIHVSIFQVVRSTLSQFLPPSRPISLGALLLLTAVTSVPGNSVVSWGRQVLPPPENFSGLMDISAGHEFNLGLRADGTPVAWGANSYRQAMVPENLNEVAAVAAGSTHALALRRDGTVVAWGDNRHGKASPPEDLRDVTEISAGDSHSLALHDDGTVTGWGSDQFDQINAAENLENVVAISAGLFHNLALLRDGTVVGWGLDDDGQASVPSGLANVVEIAAGGYHSLALQRDGTLLAWGNNDFGQASVPDLTGVTRIQAGEDHSLILFENGDVQVWGRNHYGQTNLPDDLRNGRRIAAGNHHNLVLRQDGTFTTWGYNSAGQALNQSDLQEVVAVSAWENHTIALKQDGTLFWWGANWAAGLEPNLEDLTNIVAVAAGRAHGLGLKADGTVVGWGDNLYSQAVPPEDLRDVVAVAAGEFHSLALRSDGIVVAWGNDFQGQARVPGGLNKIVAIAGGQDHSVALNNGGLPFAWGNNFYGQRAVPSELENAIAVAAGNYHNVALRQNGTLSGWGGDFFGQATVPAGLSDAVAIEASRSHTIVIRGNRTIGSWGANYFGQSDVPENLRQVVDVAAGGSRSLAVIGDLQPPGLLSRFASRLVPAGEDLFLMPLITGTPPYNYQWMKDGRPIEGGTRPALELLDVRGTDSGSYSLVLANPLGNISSRPFSIEVDDPSVIVSANPRVAVLTERAVFSSRASGTTPFQLQWYKDGEPIPAAEEPTLVLESVEEGDTGVYTVEVSNEVGTVTSEPIQFLIEPEIQQHPPETVAARIGERTSLRLRASGSPPLEVQWFYAGDPISDATEQTLVLENVSVENSGVYSAVVSNPAGRVVSEETLLEIVPHIILQPESQVFSAFGSTAVFEVRATGTSPLTYRWYKDSRPFAETTDPRLVLRNVRASDAGEYHVVVENPVGMVESEPATLMVPPEIAGHPVSQTVKAGDSVVLSVSPAGGAPFEFQWFKNGEAIPDAHTAELQFDEVESADTARYSVTVSNPVGSVSSEAATLSVSPTITRQPESVSVTTGETITLDVEAAGSEPLYYQWTRGGAALSEANAPTLTIQSANTDDSGPYTVVVSNSAGIAISNTVEVNVE